MTCRPDTQNVGCLCVGKAAGGHGGRWARVACCACGALPACMLHCSRSTREPTLLRMLPCTPTCTCTHPALPTLLPLAGLACTPPPAPAAENTALGAPACARFHALPCCAAPAALSPAFLSLHPHGLPTPSSPCRVLAATCVWRTTAFPRCPARRRGARRQPAVACLAATGEAAPEARRSSSAHRPAPCAALHPAAAPWGKHSRGIVCTLLLLPR